MFIVPGGRWMRCISPDDMDAIVALDRKVSSFLDHRNPATVKWLGEIKFNT
jgi:2,5-diketo-D-gluconate reductase A